MTCRSELLRKIQQLNFVMIDLGLYLNTHSDCERAKGIYDRVRRLYLEAKKEYERVYGPLTYDGVNTCKDGWPWINKPWPWEGEE